MELSPGVRTAIQVSWKGSLIKLSAGISTPQVLCTLALRAPEAQKQQLRLRLKPTIEGM